VKGTLRALRSEWYRLTRSRIVLGSGLFLMLVSALRVWAARVAEQSVHAADVHRALSAGRQAPPLPPPGNAWPPFVDGWLAGLTVGTLLLLIAASRSLAGDRESGLLRVARTRSISRGGLVLGRALLGFGLVTAMLLLTCLGAFLSASVLFEFGPVVENNYELVSSIELRTELTRAISATLPPLLCTWAFGLLVSALLGSGTAAVSVGLAIYLGFDLFKEVLGEGQYWVFAAFNPSFVDHSFLKEFSNIARGFSDAGYSESLYGLNLWLPWPQAALMLGLACWVTSRRAL
jgi:ABC-type transport system involved in multi-copper enzyme maturation permease subunit